MDHKLLDTYSDYLIVQTHLTTATGLSNLLDGDLSPDKITKFLNKSKLASINLCEYIKPTI
jgi:hypothetical protein